MFRTELKPEAAPFLIDHGTKILSLGSCFADVMGARLASNKFKVLSNPFGIIYHPSPLFALLDPESLQSEEYFVEKDGLWFHYRLHSQIFGNSKMELATKIASISEQLRHFIQDCNLVFFTLGTAYHYVRSDLNLIVANCHKMPAALFSKRLSNIESIVNDFEKTDALLKKINPSIRYIFTVSPVRHLKDTLSLNQVSKSILRLACHHLTESLDHALYFPAYELMIDDLRDYRFYKEDMLHPSPLAETYIWGKFANTFLSKNTRLLLDRWSEILQALQHKPFHANSDAYRNFLQDTIVKIESINLHLDASEELNMFREKLTQL